MALRSAVDFSCSVCFEIFKNPVVLSCSHSFCKDCLQTWWADKVILQCPVCKRRSSKSDPPFNLALRNLCEALLQELSLEESTSAGTEALCNLHSEKLKLFCLDHQQPVCVVCRDSRTHTNHSFRPIDEAAQDNRERLRTSLKPLQDKLEHLSQVKVNWDLTADEIKAQARQTEKTIKGEFTKLQNFLQKEEEARMTALRKEEEQKSGVMMRRIEALSREIAALSETIRITEEELKTADVSFLQNYNAAVERVKQRHLLEDPKLASGVLIDMSKHVGNLTFKVWIKMKGMVSYTPVILDPNTAEQNLLLSEDLRSVRCVERESQLPKNPERFDSYTTVLGSEGFNSGTHSWTVEVQNDANWAVGVIEESVRRQGDIPTGYWEIWFQNGKLQAYSPPHLDRTLSVKNPIQRIRVQMDWDRGKLSFFDLDTNTNIYTFSQTFTKKLFPFMNTTSTVQLRVLPMTVNVQLGM
ncbi:zinc-binding protein A33-like [Hippoglossus stenolepis]|uniref:zinc-binding protein A33-like n=1 Tax=Hippoglossus stenolepis TaxID=195615 RepID=UPI001FAE939C|nr:zinc-binding protein A33-like [Hippoglossus stenolepis]